MNFREKIYVKKSRIRKAVERENTLKGGVVQRATKSWITTSLCKKVALS